MNQKSEIESNENTNVNNSVHSEVVQVCSVECACVRVRASVCWSLVVDRDHKITGS